MKLRRSGSVVILASVLVAGLAWAPPAAADEHVKGVIQSLGGDGTVTLRTDDATNLTIVLNDYTKVRRVDGMRKAPGGRSHRLQLSQICDQRRPLVGRHESSIDDQPVRR